MTSPPPSLQEKQEKPYSSRIDWFPKHMVKAMRQIQEKIKQVDVILEVRDARVPFTSGNSEVQKMLGEKRRLIIFNKSNLAEDENIHLCEKWLAGSKIPFLFVNALDEKSVRRIPQEAKKLMQEKWATYRKKGIRPSPLRMMVLGLPNTGKSTLINQLSGRSKVKTGKLPGVTLHQQWITVGKNMELLDTPGVMPPKIDTEEQAFMLSSIHALKDEIIDIKLIVDFILDRYLLSDPTPLELRYKLESLSSEKDKDLIFQRIGKQKNMLQQGGQIDIETVYRQFIEDFRQGRLGKKSFELPPQ